MASLVGVVRNWAELEPEFKVFDFLSDLDEIVASATYAELDRAARRMAEAMLLALERQPRHFALGPDFDPEAALHVQRLAARHGFEVAKLRSFGRMLDLQG